MTLPRWAGQSSNLKVASAVNLKMQYESAGH